VKVDEEKRVEMPAPRKRGRRQISEGQWVKVLMFREQGMTLRAIAKGAALSVATVQKIIGRPPADRTCIVCGVVFARGRMRNVLTCSLMCRSERHRELWRARYAADPEHYREQDRKRRRHPIFGERERERNRAYRAANLEHARKQSREQKRRTYSLERRRRKYASENEARLRDPERRRAVDRRSMERNRIAVTVFRTAIGPCRMKDASAAKRILRELEGSHNHDNATS
jgi:hypothetical protein